MRHTQTGGVLHKLIYIFYTEFIQADLINVVKLYTDYSDREKTHRNVNK